MTQSAYISIGRDIGETGRPLTGRRWNLFRSATLRAAERAGRVFFEATGDGRYGAGYGVTEDSYTVGLELNRPGWFFYLGRLRTDLGNLAGHFGQTGIALTVGEGERILPVRQ